MTMAAAIESRTAEAPALVEGKPHRQRRYPSRSRPGGDDLARPRRSAALLYAVSAIRSSFAPWQRQVGAREDASAFHRRSPMTPNAGRCCCCRSRSGTSMAFAPPASWAASTPPSTWRCGTRDFAAERNRGRSRRADIGDTRARPTADVLALSQQPLRWRDLPNPMALLPHQASANDCPLLTMAPGAAPRYADQQFVPPAAQGQGTQAADAGRAIAIASPPPKPRSSGCSTGSSPSSRCGWRSRNCPTCSPNPASRISSAAPA